MGYSGIPSKACSLCRARRIKVSNALLGVEPILVRSADHAVCSNAWQCDLSKPSCGQCVRSGRTCFGYRDVRHLLFRDQSEEVASKVRLSIRASHRNTTAKVPGAKGDLYCAISHLDLSSSSPPEAWSPPILLNAMPAESQAFGFFCQNYPCLPSKNIGSVYTDIPAIYCFATSDSPLLSIVTALGLDGFSHRTKVSGLEVAARSWYTKALWKVNSNLKDQELAKLDETLLVVLLLGLYEVCVHSLKPQKPEAHFQHSSDKYLRHA